MVGLKALSLLGVVLCAGFLFLACEGPATANVILNNEYPAQSGLVVYQAYWQAVLFSSPVPPGTASEAQPTVAASENTAYVVVAPGWNPSSSTPPSSFILLQSQGGFSVNLGSTLTIPVADSTFSGNCASGSVLSQSQANFITQLVFPRLFEGLTYDAATCATGQVGDAG
jgi:hypothetical protein